MKEQKLSPPEDYWASPPYSSPLNRIRSMMTNLDKELSELYRKKSLEFAAKPPPSAAKTTKSGTLYPTINIKTVPSRAVSIASGRSSRGSLRENQTPATFSFERYKRYKNISMRAYQNRKIFTIYGCYPKIRQALQRRGWVEKVAPGSYKVLQAMSQHSLLKNAKDGNDYELVAISKMLEKYPTYFIWQPKGYRDTFCYALPYRNRVRRSRDYDFTTKEGLFSCIDNAHFFSSEGVASITAPRCFKLAVRDDVIEFLNDYRLTYCKSLLQYITQTANDKQLYNETSGTVPITIVDFAIQRIREAIDIKEHNDIDIPVGKEKTIEVEEWRSFIINTNRIINQVETFKADTIMFSRALDNCQKMLTEAQIYWPNMDLDGYKNIWILKPAYCCRGTGIVLMKDYDSIMSFANKRVKMRYVAQKYIERPLLIYKTKFDIRQYILITINEYVNIWIYRDCYLKFSSQEFNLNDFRESVHITNNTVQKRYKNGTRSDKLPPHNMWHLSQFQAYLKSIDKDEIWNKKIYPGMKQNIIAALLASLDETDLVVNNFELYGCDFMVDHNFNPCLIEINATPDMSASTCVTAKICPTALEDVVKVVVDLPKNSRASTGNFELIYKLPCVRVPNYATGLTIQGARMKLQQNITEPEVKGVNKFLRKNKILSGKKKIPKIITENDVKEVKGKDQVVEQNKQTIEHKKFFKKRKRAGQTKNFKSESPKLKHPVKIINSNQNNNNSNNRNQRNNCQNNQKLQNNSALSIVKKSFEIIKNLSLKAANDEVVGKQVSSVFQKVFETKNKVLRAKKTPRRLNAGGGGGSGGAGGGAVPGGVAACKEKNILPTKAKEALALKTINQNNTSMKEQKILVDFLDIIIRKMGGHGGSK